MKEIDYEYENWVKDDYRYMTGISPFSTVSLQTAVRDECDRLEYDGSIMYDEYPDKEQLYSLCRKIAGSCDAAPDTEPYIYPCLAYEMMLRRRRRCRRYGWMPR